MPKYLWQVTYTAEGAQGLINDGGTARRDAIVEMVESVGGTVDSVHFALGGHDLYVVGEVPDEIAAATLELRTIASGAARSMPIALLTPEQVDEAARRDAAYRRPGG
ncbi:GYD domain-containing protein [Rhodococcus chondri]|uniref:GYD domain-containing protein n=1 Tax=Rhodococcus chondri TaxID=3065941 RepID=A0ABU7JKM3_9NOCA|nr:GYD domain-containing protein [Rhodococcus sp. CC-R104]MEE2030585.1 GYD domain-containing protein [Rhodococcus sp. CC-R104]